MNKVELSQIISNRLVKFVNQNSDNIGSVVDMNAVAAAERIINLVSTLASDDAFKAVVECKYCYGKGYSSVLEPAHVVSPDFIGDKPAVVKPSRMEYRFCKCERGQALKHLILSNAPFVID